eukprot:4653289-Ditylum_brightwellii.AAC.1
MGKDWNIKTAGLDKFKLKHHSSALIGKLLKTDDLVPKDLIELKSIITSAHGAGYDVLYDLQYFMKHLTSSKMKLKEVSQDNVTQKHLPDTSTEYKTLFNKKNLHISWADEHNIELPPGGGRKHNINQIQDDDDDE